MAGGLSGRILALCIGKGNGKLLGGLSVGDYKNLIKFTLRHLKTWAEPSLIPVVMAELESGF